jgi:hypothetical protein
MRWRWRFFGWGEGARGADGVQVAANILATSNCPHASCLTHNKNQPLRCGVGQATRAAWPGVAGVTSEQCAWQGFAYYLFCVDGKACGGIEAKKRGATLTGVGIPFIAEQHKIVAEVGRRLSIVEEVEADVDVSLKRVQAPWRALLGTQFRVAKVGGA